MSEAKRPLWDALKGRMRRFMAIHFFKYIYFYNLGAAMPFQKAQWLWLVQTLGFWWERLFLRLLLSIWFLLGQTSAIWEMESRDVIICKCYSLLFCGCLRGLFPKTGIEYSTTGLWGGDFDILVKVSELRYRKLMASSSVTAQGFMWSFPSYSATRTSSVKGLSDASSLDHSGSLVHAPGMVVAAAIMVGFFH